MTVEPLAERLYRGAVERFAALVNGVPRDLEQAGEGEGAAPPRGVDAELGLARRSVSSSTSCSRWPSPAPARGYSTACAGGAGGWRRRRSTPWSTSRGCCPRTARVANDLAERVLESRRRLESEVGAGLRDLVVSAERSAEQARRRHAEGVEAVRAERDRIRALRERIAP